MKNLFQLFVLCALFFCSCRFAGKRVNGSGNMKTEDRTVRSAQKIKVTGDMEVIIDSGQTNVRVEADDNLIKYIVTENDDDWLEITTRDHINLNPSNTVKVYVTTPGIAAINVTGSGNVTTSKKFYSNNKMTFNITGSGDVSCNINAPRVDANLTGSGTLQVAGETRDVDVNISGSGNYEGDELKAENAVITIAGSGDASLFADARLRVKVMGSGNVRYRGNPAIDKNIMGSGSVTKIQ